MSFRFILNGLAQSFIGYIEDPDEEVNKKEAVPQSNIIQENNQVASQIKRAVAFSISENKRRAAEVCTFL